MCSTCFAAPFCLNELTGEYITEPDASGTSVADQCLALGENAVVGRPVAPVQQPEGAADFTRQFEFENGFGIRLWCLPIDGKVFADVTAEPSCPPQDDTRAALGHIDVCRDVPRNCRPAIPCFVDTEAEIPFIDPPLDPTMCPRELVESGLGSDRSVCAENLDAEPQGTRTRAKLIQQCQGVHDYLPSLTRNPNPFCFLACGGGLPDGAGPVRTGCDTEEFDPPHVPNSSIRIQFGEHPTLGPSTARVSVEPGVRRFTSTIEVAGMAAIDTPGCGPGLVCDATLAFLEVHGLEPLVIGPLLSERTYRDAQVINTDLIPGTITPIDATRSMFEIAPDEGRVYISGSRGDNVSGGAEDLNNGVMAEINWSTGEVQLFTRVGGSDRTDLTLYGTFGGLPPIADAGDDQTLGCGESVLLSAAGSTDPDGDIVSYQWSHVVNGEARFIGNGVELETTVSEGSLNRYTLVVTDSLGQTDLDGVNITFEDDGTGPELTASVQPDCLWPPNHSMHLFELGDQISASATDSCSDDVSIRIVDVRSNQPADDRGDGSTTPDVRWGTGAVCLRAERDGRDRAGRTYTIVVEADDGVGNTSQREVVVAVPHSASGGRCVDADLAPVVDEDDPRCVADAPESTTSLALSAEPEGCAAGGTPHTFGWLLLLVLWRRRCVSR